MTSPPADGVPEVDDRQQGAVTRCTTCGMEVRRTELEIHLAHAHNIGPERKKERSRDDRGSRRRSDDR